MNLKELQEHWNQFGKRDPLWAILTWNDKKGNKWNPDEFFETGRQEIKGVMQYVENLGLLQQRSLALDFGCGVGRLTQALANYFDEVIGIDIAPSMVRLANQYNRFGSRCTYHLNEKDDLRLIKDQAVNFIYTNIVLQHMKPDYAKSYIKEFLRILKSDGVLIFQLPSRNQGQSARPKPPSEQVDVSEGPTVLGMFKRWFKRSVPEVVWKWYVDRKYAEPPRMEMYGIERTEVEAFLEINGARVVDVVEDASGGAGWRGFRYCVTKVRVM